MSEGNDSLYLWDYENLAGADHWFRMARAYVDCSLHLFAGMEDGLLKRDIFHARAAAYLLEHSIELFLKAGILQAGEDVDPHHKLRRHYDRFRTLYPGETYSFQGRIEELVRETPRHPYLEFTRYPADRSGQLFGDPVHFSLPIWREQVQQFRDDFERLEPLLKQLYPAGV